MERKFLKAGVVFAENGSYQVVTVLGSCISVCLWDKKLGIGGINHYVLPLWNGEGLASPRYGNIAIMKLYERMLAHGASRKNLIAKVFGGASMLTNRGENLLEVGKRNIMIAENTLKELKISIISSDVGGTTGRKILFNTASGFVWVKKIDAMRLNSVSVGN